MKGSQLGDPPPYYLQPVISDRVVCVSAAVAPLQSHLEWGPGSLAALEGRLSAQPAMLVEALWAAGKHLEWPAIGLGACCGKPVGRMHAWTRGPR